LFTFECILTFGFFSMYREKLVNEVYQEYQDPRV
jgi:hypothetical protein